MSKYVSENYPEFSGKKWIAIVIGVVVLVTLLYGALTAFYNVSADEICVIQSPVSGTLTWYSTPGLKWRGGGTVASYKKSTQFWFSAMPDQGRAKDESIETRFNDGGHARVSGSVRVDLPMDPEKLTALHTRYGSQHGVEHELVRPTFERSIYMSGPLMSSAESYSEKRNQLINFIEEQATNGMFKTTTKLTRTKDPITGSEKTVSVVDLISDPKAPGGYARSETSPIAEFGLKAYNLSINAITYAKEVDQQIQAQQRAIMQVQTAIAESRQAEQKALTAEQEGRAEATKARWTQEAIKAKAVTEGEQRKEVAKLSRDSAEFYKQEQELKGEGDAAYKRKVMEADGALAQKLDVYRDVMGKFAAEFGKQKWVPEVVMGANGSQSGDNVNQMINLLAVKAAKDLNLDMSISTPKK